MTKYSFLKGAFILVLASITVKTLGFLYQILIIRLIGTEGIGIFNMVYPLYITVLVLATAGIPTALTKYVAQETARDNENETARLMGMAIGIVLALSTLGSFLLILASPGLIRLLYTDPRVIPAFLVMAPTLLMAAVSSCIRGYFQGLQDMRPTAVNQLIEQLIRFMAGLLLVYLLHPFGLTWAVLGLSMGIFFSEAGGLYYIWRLYRNNLRPDKLLRFPSFSTAAKLLTFGIPLTMTRITGTMVAALEGSLIPRQLMRAGATLSGATSVFGELTGVAFTLLSIPSTLTFSLAITLVPAISEALSKNQKTILAQRTSDAFGITLIAGVPSAIILFNWGQELSLLLFRAQNAGFFLRYFALGCVFLYLAQTSSGILQGTGYVKTVFFTTLVSNFIRLSGIILLGGRPSGAFEGIALSYLAGFFTLALMNLTLIRIITGFRLEACLYLRLLLAGIILAGLLKYTASFIQGSILLLVLLTIANALVFFIVLYASGDKYTRLILQHLKK